MTESNRKRLSEIAVQIVEFETEIDWCKSAINVLKREIIEIMAKERTVEGES